MPGVLDDGTGGVPFGVIWGLPVDLYGVLFAWGLGKVKLMIGELFGGVDGRNDALEADGRMGVVALDGTRERAGDWVISSATDESCGSGKGKDEDRFFFNVPCADGARLILCGGAREALEVGETAKLVVLLWETERDVGMGTDRRREGPKDDPGLDSLPGIAAEVDMERRLALDVLRAVLLPLRMLAASLRDLNKALELVDLDRRVRLEASEGAVSFLRSMLGRRVGLCRRRCCCARCRRRRVE
jgi:hypothetical protein